MGDVVHIDPEALQSAVTAWVGDVPRTVDYEELPAASALSDAATAEVLAAIAHWPAAHAAMSATRDTKASAFHGDTAYTTSTLCAADDDGATNIRSVEV